MAASGRIPEAFERYIRELHQAQRSGRMWELSQLYDKTRRDLSNELFGTSQWPDPSIIEPLVEGDEVFMLLYRLQWFKHALVYLPSKDQPLQLEQLAASYAWYARFVEELTEPVRARDLTLPADWVYDVLNEFVYLCQAFHEARCDAFREQQDRAEAGEASPPSVSVLDGVDVTAVWQVPDVLRRLQALVESSGVLARLRGEGGRAATHPLTEQGGVFALACLIRLETKLGDYGTALEFAAPISADNDIPFARVPACHLSIHYYIGFALMMARRYVDAARVLARILLVFHRTSHLLSDAPTVSWWMKKQTEKTLALLALCTTLSPGAPVEEQVAQAMRDKFGDRVRQLEGGEEEAEKGIDDLFRFAAPSFIAAAFPPTEGAEEMQDHQLEVFRADALTRALQIPKMRSFLRLYSSIDLGKLAGMAGASEADVLASLLALKIKAWQREGGALLPAAAGEFASSDALHFFVRDGMVHVEDGEGKGFRAGAAGGGGGGGGEGDGNSAAPYFLQQVAEFARMRHMLRPDETR